MRECNKPIKREWVGNREITLEGETFLDIDVTEDESLVEVEFYETN